MMALQFEWDCRQGRIQPRPSTRLSFDEASTVFADPLAKLFYDEDHSSDENREIIVGHSILNRLLLVSFTERGRDLVRIISAGPRRGKNAEPMKKTKVADARLGLLTICVPNIEFDYRESPAESIRRPRRSESACGGPRPGCFQGVHHAGVGQRGAPGTDRGRCPRVVCRVTPLASRLDLLTCNRPDPSPLAAGRCRL